VPALASDDWRDWLRYAYAEDDYREALSALGRESWRDCCFHAQQACEKLIKALSLAREVFIPIHDLRELVEGAEKVLKRGIGTLWDGSSAAERLSRFVREVGRLTNVHSVVVIGSRARGDWRPSSDIDVVIVADSRVSARDLPPSAR